MLVIDHRLGATFRFKLRVSETSVIDATIEAKVTHWGDDPAAGQALDVRVLSDFPGLIEISASADSTQDWPVSIVYRRAFEPSFCTVRVELPNGEVWFSETIAVNVEGA